MGCEIVDELEHTRLDIFPVDSIWYREDDDGSLLHRRNRFTTEVLSEVRQIIIVPDDHERLPISLILSDDIEMDRQRISIQ